MAKIHDCNLMAVYKSLSSAFGPQYWWPAAGAEEMIIGALLTQNTNWKNVEKALANLEKHGRLSFPGILKTPLPQLEEMIRPSGYFRQKSQRLKNLAESLHASGGIDSLKLLPTRQLREWFLNQSGIGPETADSILLYAFNRPIFVIDAYTLRVCKRHKWLGEKASYNEAQLFFTRKLPSEVKLFNEFHALFVKLGKNFCRSRKVLCNECPLKQFLNH